MHMWGDKDVDWDGINEAANYIGYWLKDWVRMPVSCVKEKFGSVRIYCSFGWSMIYSIWRPSHIWLPKWWPHRLDSWISYYTPIMKWVNYLVVPIHQKAYVWRYKKAVEKWPHLRREILGSADYGELFEGKIPGYKHSDYWTEVKGESHD